MSQTELKPGQYRYILKNLRDSSRRYGACLVCGGDVSEVWMQLEMKAHQRPDGGRLTGIGWTSTGCIDLFGHRACLEAQQRQPVHIIELKSKRAA